MPEATRSGTASAWVDRPRVQVVFDRAVSVKELARLVNRIERAVHPDRVEIDPGAR